MSHTQLRIATSHAIEEEIMRLITQTIYTEGGNPEANLLKAHLREHYDVDPFITGVDWPNECIWAKLTEEQHIMFVLKNPQYAGRFKVVP